jgi:hypothetical protein
MISTNLRRSAGGPALGRDGDSGKKSEIARNGGLGAAI